MKKTMYIRQNVHPVDRRVMREMNQNTLLNLIRVHAPISRSHLKELSGLSLGTIMGLTSTLIEQQLVIERGVAASTGGRKAGLLEIFPEGRYALGLHLQENHIAGALLNLNGDIVRSETWSARLHANGEQAIEIIAASIEAFIARCGVPRNKIIGIGCGVSGYINPETGVCIDDWILNWHNVEVRAPLAARLKMPVFVDNSVNCLATYEKLFGCGQHYHDFMVVNLGRGVGAAFVVRDNIYRGSHNGGAEFGHIPIISDGRLCACGKRGCLEAYVADQGILKTYQELHAATTTVETDDELTECTMVELFQKSLLGDEIANQTFFQTGTLLGLGLATLVNLMNPACIILYIYPGGGLKGEALFKPMKAAMKEHIFSQLGDGLQFIVETNTYMVNWARGAGCLVLRNIFAEPKTM